MSKPSKQKQICVNALDMNCVGCSPGLWTHPLDATDQYHKLDYWIDLAKSLEKGLYDSLFIADVLGIYDVHGGSADAPFVTPYRSLLTTHLCSSLPWRPLQKISALGSQEP